MLFEFIKTHDPKKIALCDANRSVSYGDLAAAVDAKAAQLAHVDVLAIMLDNSVDWILWDLAALKTNTPCIPIPPFFTEAQIAHLLQTGGVTHIISPHAMRDAAHLSVSKPPESTAKVTFTSGTTGTPKGVCLSREGMVQVAASIVDVLGPEFVGNHCSVLPLAVLLENIAGVYAGLIAGCTINLPSLGAYGQNYAHLHDVLKDSHTHSVILVPEVLRILMAQVMTLGSLPDLKFIAVGGSKLDADLIRQARHMGLPVYEGYGLSECASVVSLNTPHQDCIGSVGHPLPHIKCHVKDGEIYIKNTAFLGYLGEDAPDEIATGDLGEIDADGHLYVTGRKKNVLITSYGRNVSPEWVEAALMNEPAIAQVVVTGDGQSYLSALIVPSAEQANIPRAVDNANKSLPDYAQIKDFLTVPPFTLQDGTLTGTGRPRRETILNLYQKDQNHDILRSFS